MPPEVLSNKKLLQILKRIQENWNSEKIISIDYPTIKKALENENVEASRRTVYRKLQELRKEGFIEQTTNYFKKFQLTNLNSTLQEIIVVDENDQRIQSTILEEYLGEKPYYVLTEAGEIKTQQFYLTDKGETYLNK